MTDNAQSPNAGDRRADAAASHSTTTGLPRLLRGAKAIAEHLGISAASVTQQHRHGKLPTFRVGGTPYATPGALDEWRALYRAGRIPRQ